MSADKCSDKKKTGSLIACEFAHFNLSFLIARLRFRKPKQVAEKAGVGDFVRLVVANTERVSINICEPYHR
jgi:hypothetical protein